MMKKNSLFCLVIIAIVTFTQCSPKVAKQASASNSETEHTTTAVIKGQNGDDTKVEIMEESTEMLAKRMGHGKQVWSTSCNKCHELYDPSTRNAAQWERILRSMSKKAKLSEQDALDVKTYLTANAKP